MKSLRTAVQKATGVKCHSTLGWHTCHDYTAGALGRVKTSVCVYILCRYMSIIYIYVYTYLHMNTIEICTFVYVYHMYICLHIYIYKMYP